MTENWKDILGALDLPEGDNEVTPQTPDAKPSAPTVSIFYERKGRGGKEVTILADFKGLDDSEIVSLAADIKRALGTGGSARGGEILIQGDRRQAVTKFLSARGFKIK